MHRERLASGLGLWLPAAFSFAVLALVGLGAPAVRSGQTDFLSFYAGAKLVGTPNLYSPEHANRIQRPYSKPDEVRAYIRPPFYAWLLSPLGRLPYRYALLLWQALNLMALLGFVAAFAPEPIAVVLCCWFFPLWVSFSLEQDMPLILLLFGLAVRLHETRRPLLSGAAFALCGVKFHLFLLVPVVLVANRLWRVLAGLAAGAAVLIGISFAVAGPDWPARYFEAVLLNRRMQASQQNMPGLSGLLEGIPYSHALVFIFGAAIIVAVWRSATRVPVRHALGIALSGGLLVNLHSFLYDCAVLLPSALTSAGRLGNERVLLVSSLVGSATLFLCYPPLSHAAQVLLVAVLVVLVRDAHHTPPAKAVTFRP